MENYGTEQFENLSLSERLQKTLAVREQIVDLLKKKIDQLNKERDEMVAEYEEEIGSVRSQLSCLGAGTDPYQPTDISIKAYNYLREHAGEWIQAGVLMEAIRCKGAFARVVLAAFIQNGKVTIGSVGMNRTRSIR